jgi:molybdenum cofactor cytidylyltransferase
VAEWNDSEIAVIVLAAGSSSRLGRPKQLLAVGEQTLLEKSVATALQSTCKNVIVVLGANEAAHRAVIEHYPVAVVFNSDWAKGMGSSLKAGLAHVELNFSNLAAVIIMVCDQPLLTPAHLNQLVDRHNATGKPIIASYYSGATGVPALFDKSVFPALRAMDDQYGAKKIINLSKEFVDMVDFPDGAIDLDTPDDLERFFDAGSGG